MSPGVEGESVPFLGGFCPWEHKEKKLAPTMTTFFFSLETKQRR